jgi:hypothetical protein
MKSKSGRSNLPADGGIYEHPVDSCNHLVATSLRDLGSQYRNLTPERADGPGLKLKNAAAKDQEAKPV